MNDIPDGAVRNQADYEDSEEDERRLFYVACTRAKKYLTVSTGGCTRPRSAPGTTPRRSGERRMDAFAAIAATGPGAAPRQKLKPEPARSISDVTLSFSELKYAFECPYSFKLRFIYGFNPPIDEALGYGKGLHDALFELHDRALHGGDTTVEPVDELVDRHLFLPFAYTDLSEKLNAQRPQAARRLHRRRGARPSTTSSTRSARSRSTSGTASG